MSDAQNQNGQGEPPVRKKRGRPPFIKPCKICTAPQDIQAEVKQMLVGTPGNPFANPPTKATWVTPVKVAEWLSSLPTPIPSTAESVRWHQYQHLKLRRPKKVKTKPFVAVVPPAPPTPTAPDERTKSGAKKRYRRGGYTDTPPHVTLPVGPHHTTITVTERVSTDGNAPPLSDTTLLDPPPPDDAEQTRAATNVVNVEVVSGGREEEELDRLALAPPPQANTELAYFELAFREQAKAHAHIARQLRKRPDGALTQAEAYLLVNGPKSLSEALVNYRQAVSTGKGGRFGAPVIQDQKRGLKGLLRSERTVIPGDLPPPNAEPVGVPTPLEEQVAATTQSLPVGREGIPDKVDLPSPSLSDLPSPSAPASSPRPVIIDAGPAGEAPTRPEPMQKAVGDDVVGEERGGATVTPIKPITPKKWDSVT